MGVPTRDACSLGELRIETTFPQLGDAYYSVVPPTPVPHPRLLHANPDAAALIDLAPEAFQAPEFTGILAGNQLIPNTTPLAMLYAGHQFGSFVPQLGDGRALQIAEVRNQQGELWSLQLKGAGPTPYSRFADGRAVLRSSIREYLCSEAMHHLGIPTTRALSLIGSSERVRRETVEPAAIVCRMAPSFVRFGSFEVFYYREQMSLLKPLADHVIRYFYPQFENDYAGWLTEVVKRTAELMAQWQTVGFCHGVMNTDNFSILGLTLDYGPFGFMDGFDAGHICNHSDEGGRYAYDRQPAVGHWNCSRLLQATLPLLSEDPQDAVTRAQAILDTYPGVYASAVTARWRAKLGLQEAQESDAELINRFLHLLHKGHDDFTRSFRLLAIPESLRDHLVDTAGFDAWLPDYRARLTAEQSEEPERAARMNRVNPKYVLRNHLLQNAIRKAESGDDREIARLFELVRHPFHELPGSEGYFAVPPPEARHIAVSCSS